MSRMSCKFCAYELVKDNWEIIPIATEFANACHLMHNSRSLLPRMTSGGAKRFRLVLYLKNINLVFAPVICLTFGI